jgi:hypothetical protein
MHAWESVSSNARCTIYARMIYEKRTHEKRYFWQPKRSHYCISSMHYDILCLYSVYSYIIIFSGMYCYILAFSSMY